jgi:hypothetical protein
MPSIRDSENIYSDLDRRLREAIDNWDPQRPRRWMVKYGGWRIGKRSILTLRYCELRDTAQALLMRY